MPFHAACRGAGRNPCRTGRRDKRQSGVHAMTSHQGAEQATYAQAVDPAASRILIVDDEPKIRSFVGRALSAAGYAIDFADTGVEGLRQALGSGYDLIILDLVMPDMDGRIVLERLLSARPDQAVMVLSCL